MVEEEIKLERELDLLLDITELGTSIVCSMLYIEKPENFNPRFEVVSCFVECDGEILLLHRQDNKPQGNTWGVPAGKVEKDETGIKALVREIKEEIGYSVDSEKLEFLKRTFVQFPEYDFTYDMYRLILLEKPIIVLDHRDHKDYKWVTPQKALKVNLIQDEDVCIRLCYPC